MCCGNSVSLYSNLKPTEKSHAAQIERQVQKQTSPTFRKYTGLEVFYEDMVFFKLARDSASKQIHCVGF